MTPKRVLIFGGTFDPPHRAHVLMPQHVAREIAADRLLYVPTSANPLKDDTPTSASDRLAMLRIALRDCELCEISTLEINSQGPSYTADTLERLKTMLGPDVDLRLLIGADAALTFHRWKDPDRIQSLATPVVVLRPPYDADSFRNQLRDIYDDRNQVEAWMSRTVNAPMIDIDATSIREQIARGETPPPDVLDPEVLAYIRAHGLYQREC